MPALTRKFKKIFGINSANNGVFGSKAAGVPANSTNPETIESLTAFLNGWDDATQGGLKLPTLEDMQGLKYDTDYHLAYIYETGMQVYNSQTTYYIGDLVRKDATTEIWKSLIDNNTGNALVSGSNWSLVGNLANIPTSPIVDASTTAKGIIKIATNAEVTAGTDTTKAIVPSALALKQLNVAKITHQLSSGTAGGGSTALAWSTRPLNTIAVDPNSIVTLNSNQFTLPAGTYKISAFQCLAYVGTSIVSAATSRIRNITDSTTPIGGLGVNCGIAEGTAGAGILLNIQPFVLTIATSKVFELQYYTPVPQTSVGLGEAASSGELETYASVCIERI